MLSNYSFCFHFIVSLVYSVPSFDLYFIPLYLNFKVTQISCRYGSLMALLAYLWPVQNDVSLKGPMCKIAKMAQM